MIDAAGYVRVWVGGDHPEADSKGYAKEHRLVMAERLRRTLGKEERVHHVNGKLDDNRPENLWLFPTHGSHGAWHRIQEGGELRTPMPAVRT